ALPLASGQGVCDVCRGSRFRIGGCIYPPTPRSPTASLFTVPYGPELRSCRLLGAFIMSSLPPLLPKALRTARPLRSAGIAPLGRCRVGGGALVRWPPSAAQTGRTIFPYAAFTKTHASRDAIEGIILTKLTRP